MIVWLMIFVAIGVVIYGLVRSVVYFMDTNDWIKAPMNDEDLKFAIDCNIFDGDENAIMADQLKAKQIMYYVKTSCVQENEGFTFSLSQGDDYAKFPVKSDFEHLARALYENEIPYYAYKVSHKVREGIKGRPDVYTTDYFVKVAPENAEVLYALFDSLELYGDKYRYYIQNGEEYYEAF